MVAAYRPDLALYISYNANPNSTDVPTWTNETARLRSADAIRRGRQYELDQNQASQPTVALWDPDEYLNPANTAAPAPYQGNIQPYRQILFQAGWPNPIAGNLLNTNSATGADPSFESYTNGAAAPSWILTTGSVTPTITTTNPQQGTKDLTFAMLGNSAEQGVGWTVSCMPGRQYAASAYVRQTAANTMQIFVNGGASGTSTTTTGAYVRLTVTFTATQPTHQIWVAAFTPTLASTVNVDALQHEPGASASAFTTSGSVIYNVFRDYVERWPSTWDYAGFVGLAEVTCVDAFAAVNAAELDTEYQAALLAKGPAAYWPLRDGSSATAWSDISGNGQPALVRMDGKYGPGTTFQAGAATNLLGDPGGTGLSIDSGAVGGGAFLDIPTSVAQTGIGQTPDLVGVGAPGGPTFGLTMAIWAAHTAQVAAEAHFVALVSTHFSTRFVLWTHHPGPDTIEVMYLNNDPNGAAVQPIATDVWADGKMHLYVATVTVTAGSPVVGTARLYVDGVQKATDTKNTLTNFWGPPWTFNSIQIGGVINPDLGFTESGFPGGKYAHLAIWNRELSSGEVSDLWNAGQGYSGETSGARVARYLGYTYTGTTVVDTGQSVMGPATVTNGTKALAAIQNVTTSENGNFWVDSSGQPTFAARTRRYLATTSAYTFGENVAAGEIPYQEGIGFSLDPTQVRNDVEVTRSGGTTAVGGTSAAISASQKVNFKQTYTRTIDVLSDGEAQDAANYLFNQYSTARQRVEQIVIDPAAYPAAWPVILNLEVGMRVTVKRRPKAANAGAGITMAADYFVEQIEHGGINMDAGTWTTTLLLSPVDLSQVGILDNGTYGRFASAGAQLNAGISATATTAVVNSTGGDVFTQTGVPFTATIDNETVTVTAVTSATSPQTFTIVRPTDGTAVAHSAGAPVQVSPAFVFAY